MAKTLEYTFSLQDKLGGQIEKIITASERMHAKFSKLQHQVNSVNKTFNETGRTLGALREKAAALRAEKEWIPLSNTQAIRAYSREINLLGREIEKLESRKGNKFKEWGKEVFNTIPGSQYLRNPLLGIFTTTKFASESAMKYDESMAKINLTAQLDPAGLADLKKRLTQIAVDNKTDILMAPAGFEKINAQLHDTELSLSVLDASLKGSKAGLGDLDTISATLAQTLAMVGKENLSVKEVLDTFIAAKQVGGTNFADFAGYMPGLMAGASALGMNFKEVAGTFAYMTNKGASAQQAATLIENAFSALGRTDIQKKMAGIGIPVLDEQQKMRSMVDIFKELQAAMEQQKDISKSSFLEQIGLVDNGSPVMKSAKSAFAVLTSDSTQLQTAIEGVTNSFGATERAISASKNSMQKAAEVSATFKNIGVQLGILMLPAITAGLSFLQNILNAVEPILGKITHFFSSWIEQLQAGNPLIWGLTGSLVALSAILLVNYIRTKNLMTATKEKLKWDMIQEGVTKLVAGVQWILNGAFLACPLTWIVVGFGVLVASITYCWMHCENFRKIIFTLWEAMKELGRVLWSALITPFEQILKGLGSIGEALLALVNGQFKEAATKAVTGFKEIGKGFLNGNPIGVTANVIANGDWKGVQKRGVQIGSESWAASQEKEQDAEKQPEAKGSGSQPFSLANLGIEVPSFSKNAGSNLTGDVLENHLSGDAGFTGEPDINESSRFPWDSSNSSPVIAPPGNSVNTTPYLENILSGVRKIAAAVAIPVALSAPVSAQASPFSTDPDGIQPFATAQNDPNSFGYSGYPAAGKNIQVSKICDQLVFRIENGDGNGIESIKTEIINVLNEICDGYSA